MYSKFLQKYSFYNIKCKVLSEILVISNRRFKYVHMHINTSDNMPGFDGTGPRGFGPMTGGGRGFCTGYFPPTYPYLQYPLNRFYPPVPQGMAPTTTLPRVFPSVNPSGLAPASFTTPFGLNYNKEQEIQMLKQQVTTLESQLKSLKQRLGELK